jgi:hypothetical protein
MAISVWSATESKVKVDGEDVEGVQSLEYKVNRNRTDVVGIGQHLRSSVEYGVKTVIGTLRVKSSCPKLDDKLGKDDLEQAKFTLQAQLKKGGTTKTVDLQDCYLDGREFTIDVNGVGVSVYTFSATNIVESG